MALHPRSIMQEAIQMHGQKRNLKCCQVMIRPTEMTPSTTRTTIPNTTFTSSLRPATLLPTFTMSLPKEPKSSSSVYCRSSIALFTIRFTAEFLSSCASPSSQETVPRRQEIAKNQEKTLFLPDLLRSVFKLFKL